MCVKMSTRNPSDFTVNRLKEKLRELGLSSAGSKSDLIKRLAEADPSGAWMTEVQEIPEASAAI